MQLIIKVLSVVAGASLLAVVVSGAKGMKPIFEIQRERNDKPKVGPRIVNGVPALPNEFPYAVEVEIIETQLSLIEIDILSKPYGICSGSIIGRRAILTAGHCVIPDHQDILGLVTLLEYSYRIRGGSVNVNSFTFDVTTDVAYQHDNYNAKTGKYDAGILVLSQAQAFKFDTSNVQPLSLAADPSLVNDGQLITVAGFGYTSNNATATSTTLQKTDLYVVSTAVCQTSYTDTIPSTSFCAESHLNSKSSICSGDSGGPVLVLDNGIYVGVGISAFGSSDGCNLAPQGFTNIFEVNVWIDTTLSNKGLY